jgi:hypothetical protein
VEIAGRVIDILKMPCIPRRLKSKEAAMRTSRALAFLCVFVIEVGLLPAQDVGIKSGSFTIQCKATEAVNSNPDFLAVYETIISDLKAWVDSNPIPFTKNIELRADIVKSASSGKILNGVMIKIAIGGSEPDATRGTFFPCKDPTQSDKDYREMIYNDYFKMVTDKILNLNK